MTEAVAPRLATLEGWEGFEPASVETPCHVVNLQRLRSNAERLADVQRRAECKILLALKGFAMWHAFPMLRRYLAGTTASSPDEARLGFEYFGGELHAYAPAYSEADLLQVRQWADHVVFNSPGQWQRFRELVHAGPREISCGMRVNPEHSEVEVALYDPCAPGSRLGARLSELPVEAMEGLSGLHVHALCESGSDALERMVGALESHFAAHLQRVRWLNLGGGHHITRADYDVERLIALVRRIRQRWAVEVYLEPGEAIALDAGVLVARVLDIVPGPLPVAVLDTSATAHMPDVLEMPYRPKIVGAEAPGVLTHTYRLGGLSCLAGDVVGDYSFPDALTVGSVLVFEDMAHYSMVKSTTFNGVRLPSIATFDPATKRLFEVRRFGFEDYASRLS